MALSPDDGRQVMALCVQRRQLAALTPAEEHPKVGLGVVTRRAAVARQVGNGREAELTRLCEGGIERRQAPTVPRTAQSGHPPEE